MPAQRCDDAETAPKSGRASAAAKKLSIEVKKSGQALKQRGIDTPFSNARMALQAASFVPSINVPPMKLNLGNRNANGTVYIPLPPEPEPEPPPPATLTEKLDMILLPGPVEEPVRAVPEPEPWFGGTIHDGQHGAVAAGPAPGRLGNGSPGGMREPGRKPHVAGASEAIATDACELRVRHQCLFDGHPPVSRLSAKFPLDLTHRLAASDVVAEAQDEQLARMMHVWQDAQRYARGGTSTAGHSEGGMYLQAAAEPHIIAHACSAKFSEHTGGTEPWGAS